MTGYFVVAVLNVDAITVQLLFFLVIIILFILIYHNKIIDNKLFHNSVMYHIKHILGYYPVNTLM